ncbi:MAG TPA: Ppx/GppA phosphatase family protein [Bryobacteraceae bacterium]|nr:Ppx/GppA phosphatase family protein [Bryobacteraceae bacterium]
MPRYAAIDVGSNSVRMQAAEVAPSGTTAILVSERQVTRIGESVFRTGRISREAMETVCATLRRMAEAYAQLNVVGVRAVATSAVRDASNQHEFLERASQAIGAPLEIISGQEEARLIHLGVQARWPHAGKSVLIVDVGGGSVEIVHSEDGQLVSAFSKPLGAVRLTEAFLKSDPPAALELHRMREYIDEKLATPLRRIGPKRFDRIIATSATAAALICAARRIPRTRREEADRLRATLPEIRRLYTELSQKNLARRRRVSGIGPKRAEIIVAGAAVFTRVLQLFEHRSMYYSAAGVRDGIIADLAARGVGRELSILNREQRKTVETMARRYHVQVPHARKVANLASRLFETLHPLHRLAPNYGRLLEASAYLHDIGHFVSDTSHHKHSCYLVAHSDMPGFTDLERLLIALLCRYHRKSMPSPRHASFQAFDPEVRRVVTLLAPLLRLADSLDRSHEQKVDSVDARVRNGSVLVRLESEADTDLEIWAAERTAEVFREVYRMPLALSRVKP